MVKSSKLTRFIKEKKNNINSFNPYILKRHAILVLVEIKSKRNTSLHVAICVGAPQMFIKNFTQQYVQLTYDHERSTVTFIVVLFNLLPMAPLPFQLPSRILRGVGTLNHGHFRISIYLIPSKNA